MSRKRRVCGRPTHRQLRRMHPSPARFFHPLSEKLEERVLLATDVFSGTQATLTLELGGAGGAVEVISLQGTSTVDRDDIPRDDVGANGLDDVDLQLTNLSLTGVSDSLGPIAITLADPGPPSLGFAEEAGNAIPQQLEPPVFSLLAMFPQLSAPESDINGVAQQPLALQAVLSQIPPARGESYQFNGVAQLVDAVTGQPIPVAILSLTQTFLTEDQFVEHDVFDDTTAIIQLVGGAIGPVPTTYVLQGRAAADVTFDGPSEGSAIDDSPPDGLEEVETELTLLDLIDASGSIRLTESPSRQSAGVMTEQRNNTPGQLDVAPFTAGGAVDSTFGVFFELEVDGQILHNEDALLLDAVIYEKPPFRRYVDNLSATGPIELFDSENSGTGILLLKAEHSTGKVEIDEFGETVGQFLLELPSNPAVVSTSPDLPSLDGAYRSQPPGQAIFTAPGVQVVMENIQQTILASPPPTASVSGSDELQQFGSALRGSVSINGGGSLLFDLRGNSEAVAFGKAGQTTGSWDTEILSMDLQGSAGNQAIQIRESPTEASPGQTTVTPLADGNFQIDSSFQLSWEISLDDGTTWVRGDQPLPLQAMQTGVLTTDPQVPSLAGPLRSTAENELAFLGPGIDLVLQDVRQQTTRIAERVADGNDELTTFEVTLQALATLNGGPFDDLIRVASLSGVAQTRIVDKVGNTTGTFLIELLSLELLGQIGNTPLRLGAVPGPNSEGEVTIRELADSQFHIASFLDIFTELSIDGGPTLVGNSPLHIELEKPPTRELVAGVGTSTVAVHFEGPNEGDATDEVPDGANRDEVPAEIIELELRGPTSLGPAHITLRPGFFSNGLIEEININDLPGVLQVPPFDTRPSQTALSTFSVWSQLDIGSQQLVTREPFFLESVIGHKPPIDQERYEDPNPTPVPLFDTVTGEFTGMYVLKQIHQTSSTIEHDLFPVTVGQLLLDVQGTQVLIPSVGSSQVDVFFEGSSEGVAIDDDGNGLDEVVAQIVDLELAGPTPLGPIRISLDPNNPSLGRIEERANNSPGILDIDPFAAGNAESFFDVAFTIDLNGRRLAPAVSTRLESVIEDKPPTSGERYTFAPADPIELIDTFTGQGTGIFIVREIHDPAPFVEHDQFNETVGQILLEVAASPGVSTTVPRIPPPGSVYKPASGEGLIYPGPIPILFQGLEMRPLADPPPTITIQGQDEVQQFQASLRGTAFIGGQPVTVDLEGSVTAVTRGRAGQTTGSWETEIVSMDLRGALPGGPAVAVRESPTDDSLGRATVRALGDGTFHVDSFFEVVTEVSVNDGLTWISAAGSTRLDAFAAGAPSSQPVVAPSNSVFNAARDVVFASPLARVVLQNVRAEPLSGGEREIVGDDEIFRFDSRMTAISLGPTGILTPLELQGKTEIIARGKASRQTGTFATEIVSLNLTGSIDGVMLTLRESPLFPSLGETTITDLDGSFHVDSFFNVFTELSTDGGASFAPASQSTPIVLAERPAQILVTAVGPSAVDVYFEGPNAGNAQDDDSNGRDEVVAQLVDLQLVGPTPLGPLSVSLNRSVPALGLIEELSNNTPGLLDLDPFAAGNGTSFFDLSFQFQLNGQVLLPLTTTSRFSTTLESKPPENGERYAFNPPAPIPLIDAATGRPAGFSIVRQVHQPASTVERDLFPTTVGQLLLDVQGTPVLISSVGPTQIDVFFEGYAEGVAFDDDRNGRDEVAAQVVDLSLAGPSPLGPINVFLNPTTPSLGQIEERTNTSSGLLDVDPFAAGNADSFFDLSFIVEVNGRRLAPAEPTRLEAVIEDKPPQQGERYVFAPDSPVELIDTATGQGTGIFVVREIHDVAVAVEHDRFPNTTRELLLEIPAQPIVNSNSATLPPAGSVYLTDGRLDFNTPQQIEFRNFRLRPLADPPPIVTTEGLNERQQFEASVRLEASIGGAQQLLELRGPVTTLSLGKAGQSTGSFETEILSMNLSGQVPGGPLLRLRESVENVSSGRTGIVDLGDGTFQIESFFDLRAELSLDEGQTWNSSADVVRIDAFANGVVAPTSDLPPDGGLLRSLPGTSTQFPGAVNSYVLEDLRLQSLALTSRATAGPHEVTIYEATFSGIAFGSNGVPTPFDLRGPVQTIVFERAGNTDGVFQTEILSMDLVGFVGENPVQVQESPATRSLGETTISDLGGRNGFHVDQFMEIVIELSIDAGQSFTAAAAPIPFVLTASPQLVTLTATGSSEQEVYFEGPSEGDAIDDDLNGLDEVVTQVVNLELGGVTPLGPATISLNPGIPSLGRIEEQLNNVVGTLDIDPFAGGDALTFLDTAWQINLNGTTLIPLSITTRLEGLLFDKPPRSGEVLQFEPLSPLPLVNAVTGRRTGYSVVRELQFSTAPQFIVENLTPTSSGFTVEVNNTVDLSQLNLIDSQAAELGPPDVVVRGQSTGLVAGSLVVDPTATRLQFIKTGGPLSADTYTVTLRSGSTGLVDTDGNLLDGDADGTPGDDYVTSFSVSPPPTNGVVISVPDFVRGPGQEVHLPANLSSGIPLTISNGAGVREIDLRIDFDAERLQLFDARVGAEMPAGATVQLDTSVPGIAIVTFSSRSDLPAGTQTFVNLFASVPELNANAIYNSGQLLHLNAVTVRTTAAEIVPAIADDALHIVSYLADPSGNARVNASDASRIARVAALVDTGFDAFQLVDPVVIGDVSGNGRLNASDASRVARFAALIEVPEIPPIPRGVVSGLLTGGSDPKLSIPQTLTAAARGTVSAPVLRDSFNNLTVPHRPAQANAAILFDPAVALTNNPFDPVAGLLTIHAPAAREQTQSHRDSIDRLFGEDDTLDGLLNLVE